MHVGTKALVLTQTEVDMSGKSYFGETNLYYMDSNGKFDQHVTLGTALSFPFFFLFFFLVANQRSVTTDKEGPIHEVAWSPNGREFVVVYGCTLLFSFLVLICSGAG